MRAGGIALLPILLLAGCGASPPRVITKIEMVRPRIPPALLACPTAPVVPKATRQSQVATYVAELWQAHEVCHAHLVTIAHTLKALPTSSGSPVIR